MWTPVRLRVKEEVQDHHQHRGEAEDEDLVRHHPDGAHPDRELELVRVVEGIGPEPEEDDVAHEERDPERGENEGHVAGMAAQAREHHPVEEQGDGGGEPTGEDRRDHQRPAKREGADGPAERFVPWP